MYKTYEQKHGQIVRHKRVIVICSLKPNGVVDANRALEGKHIRHQNVLKMLQIPPLLSHLTPINTVQMRLQDGAA